MTTREQIKDRARKQLARMEREYAKMPPELAAYWRGSASHLYVRRMADGDFKTIETETQS